MKKITFLFVFFVFFTNYTFAQETKISDQQAIEKIKSSFCDCFNESTKDFSPKFHKIFDKMAKDIRTKSQLNVEPMRKHFEKNKAEFEKFEKLSKDGKVEGGCEFDFEEDLDMSDDEFKKFFAKNINEINALMKKDKKCNKGLVIYNLWIMKMSEKK